MAESKECYLCHRIGYRAFVPFGDWAWVCDRDDLCRARVARRAAESEPDDSGSSDEGTIMSTLAIETPRNTTTKQITDIAVAIMGWWTLNDYAVDDDEILDLLRERDLEDSDENVASVRGELVRQQTGQEVGEHGDRNEQV